MRPLRDLRHAARAFLRRGPEQAVENEQEMAANRMVIITILYGGVLLFGAGDASLGFDFLTLLYCLYLGSGLGVYLHVRRAPQTRTWRQIVAMSIDVSALTYVAWHFGPMLAGFLYAAYLLIIYGYGFRYGVRWLVASSIVSIGAFAVVVGFAPAWRDSGMMGGGVLIGLAIIPLYALKLVRNLWQAKAKAEESSHAKSMFVAAVSHDLRTPLNAIIGLGDILAASRLSREEADMARLIGEAGRSLLAQIDSILEFSRLEMGRDPVPHEQIDLFEMLNGVRTLLGVSAQAGAVRLVLRIDAAAPARIVSSARHIRDSLVNLVGNAIKFTPGGDVEVRLSKVASHGSGVRLRFEVRDTGIGIGEEEQARIFERFSQANASIRENYGGSGLGLAIARQLVSALGGEIGVSSRPGVGSVFWFEIEAEAPAAAASNTNLADARALLYTADPGLVAAVRATGVAAQAQSSLSSPAEAAGSATDAIVVIDGRLPAQELMQIAVGGGQDDRFARSPIVYIGEPGVDARCDPAVGVCAFVVRDLRDAGALAAALHAALRASAAPRDARPRLSPRDGLSVLVAEDNKTNQKVVAKMLALCGQRATIVDDGRAVLVAVAREEFDVILMDINMPDLDGVEATRRLREQERSGGRRTPVIALTADVTPETRARCIEAGIDDCVTKPIDMAGLMRTIQAVLGDGPAASRARGARATPARAEDGAREPDKPSDIDQAALADLERLGGPDFVREVATQFAADAALILEELACAVRKRDIEKFRDEAHALRSCSANVGARSIYELCLSWRDIGPYEFASEGAAHVARLSAEFEKARARLSPYLGRAA